MARAEARIYSTIWNDADFRALGWHAQWLYFAFLSQPDLSMCGVLTVATERWARLSSGAKTKDITAALAQLDAARFVVHDDSTAEVWVRSFLRRDGVLRTPNLIVAMSRAFDAVHSADIRRGVVGEFLREFGDDWAPALGDRFPKAQGLSERLSEGFRQGLHQPSPEGIRDAVHGPCTHVRARPPITESTEVTPSPDEETEESEEPLLARQPALSHELLTNAKRTPEHLDELDAIVAGFVDQRGPDAVTAAVQQLVDDRRRYAWPSAVRRALEAILGAPPARGETARVSFTETAEQELARLRIQRDAVADERDREAIDVRIHELERAS